MVQKEATEKMKQLPAFKFYTVDKQAFTHKDLLTDQPVVIIHFSPDCENCQHEAVQLQSKMDLLQGVQILMITADKKADVVTKFMNDYKLNLYPLITPLMDIDYTFFKSFGMEVNPLIFIYGKDGNLKKYYKGETKIEAIKKALQE
jgi:peroxiredoxin